MGDFLPWTTQPRAGSLQDTGCSSSEPLQTLHQNLSPVDLQNVLCEMKVGEE